MSSWPSKKSKNGSGSHPVPKGHHRQKPPNSPTKLKGHNIHLHLGNEFSNSPLKKNFNRMLNDIEKYRHVSPTTKVKGYNKHLNLGTKISSYSKIAAANIRSGISPVKLQKEGK